MYRFGYFFQLRNVLPDNQNLVVGMPCKQLPDNLVFCFVLARNPVLFAQGGGGILNLFADRQGDAYLRTIGMGNPALFFQLLPRHIIALRADETKHIPLAAVLPDQRCR